MPVLETRHLVGLWACGAEPSANSFLRPAEHDRDGEDGHRVDEVVGQERMDEFGTTLGDKLGAVFVTGRLTSAMSRRSTEP